MTLVKHHIKPLLAGMAVFLLLSALAVTVVAFHPGQALAASDAPATHKNVSITTINGTFAFSPQTVTITVGMTIIWTNNTTVSHTVTSNSGHPLNSGLIAPGGTFRHTFKRAGTFGYHCSIHPFMTGTIIVN
jgi:plastocyanin